MRIAYVVSRYPAVSHTFIQREVLALRRLGLAIDTFSIRRTEPSELLSKADRAEFSSTFSILPARLGRLLAAHLRALLTRPHRYIRACGLALRMGSGGLREMLWQLFYFAEAVVLWDECHARGIRHFHAHFANVASDVALLAAELARGGGREESSWSFTVHGVDSFEHGAHRLAGKVERASLVVCVSDFGRSQLMCLVDQRHWPKLRIVRCGVDVDAFRPGPVPTAGARDADGRGPLRILCVARLAPVKGHAVLLDAIAELVRRGVAVAATLVGDGPTRGALEELAERRGVASFVRFEGAVGQDSIRDHYAAADVFCLPSFAEGLPVVLMEAMAMGLPVVATRIMGTPELVEDGKSGRLVSPARADHLADALAELARAPERAQSMGRAGRQKVLAEFDVERSAERLRQVLLEASVASPGGELPSRDSAPHALSVSQA